MQVRPANLRRAPPAPEAARERAFAATEEACDLLAQARGQPSLCASLLTPLYPHTCSLYAHLSAHACPLRPRQAREAQGESAYGADRGLGTSGHAYAHPAAAAAIARAEGLLREAEAADPACVAMRQARRRMR